MTPLALSSDTCQSSGKTVNQKQPSATFYLGHPSSQLHLKDAVSHGASALKTSLKEPGRCCAPLSLQPYSSSLTGFLCPHEGWSAHGDGGSVLSQGCGTYLIGAPEAAVPEFKPCAATCQLCELGQATLPKPH